MSAQDLQDLILVTGHAVLKDIEANHPENDQAWILQEYQKSEPSLYLEQIRHGVLLALQNPRSLLIFSGGRTRQGVARSEAESCFSVAAAYNWWVRDQELRENVKERTGLEEFARDSFENLLFGVCRFQQVTGRYPQRVVVVSWAFMGFRFNLHRMAIGFPKERYHFEGVNDPIAVSEALKGERRTMSLFLDDHYGAGEELRSKRVERNPFNEQHRYSGCPGLAEFFAFIEDPENGQEFYPFKLPWQD